MKVIAGCVIEKDNNILMVDKIFYILKKNLLKTFWPGIEKL